MQTLKFQAPASSQEFSILSTLSGLHVTARQKNIDLLKLLGSKGVAFKDIRNHLLNEAKRCGLWEAGKREDHYKNKAWYVAVVNFMVWKGKRYSDYNVAKDVEKVVKIEKPKEIIRRTEYKAPVEIQSAGPSASEILESSKKVSAGFKTPNPDEVKTVTEQAEITRLKDLVAAAGSEVKIIKADMPKPLEAGTKIVETGKVLKDHSEVINRPIEDCLTTIQIQTIIFKNLEILGQKATELGAGNEFNALMIAMGLVDEMIAVDDPEMIMEVTELYTEELHAN